MPSTVDSLNRWLGDRIALPRANDQVLVDSRGVDAIVAAAAQEISATGGPLAGPENATLRELLQLFVVDERDPRRGLVGGVAIRVSPTTVAGAVLATLSIVAWALGGAGFGPTGGLTLAAALRTAVSAISKLTPEERSIVALALSAKRLEPSAVFTIADLLGASPGLNLNSVTAARLLTQLREKGAIAWSGEELSDICVNKWF